MRRILLALIVLACSLPTAEAARRDDTTRTTAGRSAQAQQTQEARSRSTREETTRRSASSRSSSRDSAASRSTSRQKTTSRQQTTSRSSRNGVAARGTSAAAVPRNAAQECTRRNGRTRCAPAQSSVAGWQSGLPNASYAQQECPAGTFATLARGHDDVVRCMPL